MSARNVDLEDLRRAARRRDAQDEAERRDLSWGGDGPESYLRDPEFPILPSGCGLALIALAALALALAAQAIR